MIMAIKMKYQETIHNHRHDDPWEGVYIYIYLYLTQNAFHIS